MRFADSKGFIGQLARQHLTQRKRANAVSAFDPVADQEKTGRMGMPSDPLVSLAG